MYMTLGTIQGNADFRVLASILDLVGIQEIVMKGVVKTIAAFTTTQGQTWATAFGHF